MTDDLILAYDVGTTGNKATLFTADGSRVASAFKEYATLYPEPGWAEQRPADWWASVVQTTRDVREFAKLSPKQIVAIGLSGHMMGCLPVTADGTPIANAMIHSDSRSVSECSVVAERLGEDSVYRITGQRLDPHYTLTKAMWCRKNLAGFAQKTGFLLQCKDYIVFKLTGRLGITDFSDATLSALFDINTLKWSDELLDAAGINRSLLAEVVPSNTVVGTVSAEAARQTGLCEGIPVVSGAGDGACATLGAGVATPGDAYNYIGGTSWIATLVTEPDIDPEMRLFTMGSVDYGRFCSVGTIQSAGSSLEWVADEICREEKQAAMREGVNPFSMLDRLAEASPPGARNLFFLPYMMGERSPIWDPRARGAFLGLTLGHTRAELVRAVLEGVAFALRSVLDAMEERRIRPDSLRIIGGGARSALWREIMASVYNMPLHTLLHPEEATSLGAALVAGVGVGCFANYDEATSRIGVDKTVMPREEWLRGYQAAYACYQSLYPALKETFARLHSASAAAENGTEKPEHRNEKHPCDGT